MEREEGEMSDDNAMSIGGDSKDFTMTEEPTLLFKSEKNRLVIEKWEKLDASKLEERAKRFGINLTGSRVITQTQIDELYQNFGIKSGNERHFRFDTIHLNGVEGLSTKEIFEYLEDYKPVSLEWMNETSCNVVCFDHVSAALALLVHSREIRDDNLKQMLQNSSQHWREGMPHPKKDLILMRFGTNSDKKKILKKKSQKLTFDEVYDESMEPISKNPWGDLCKSWGVYDHQEVFHRKMTRLDDSDNELLESNTKHVQIKNKNLASRLGKRTHVNVAKDEESGSDSEWNKKMKEPRMRMHADDEETKLRKKVALDLVKNEENESLFAPLSIEVVNSVNAYTPRQSISLSDKFNKLGKVTNKESIMNRLGTKVAPVKDTEVCDEYSSDDSEHHTMSRVQRVNRIEKLSSVWSRIQLKPVESTAPDLRIALKTKKQSKSDDLRQRLRKNKTTNLRIEIDNNREGD